MAARYSRWLIAKGNIFSPEAASVVKLVEALRKEKWIALPADAAKLRYRGMPAERAQATGGYAVKTVENRFGTDVTAKIGASTEPLPSVLGAEWLDDGDREELRLVWPVSGKRPLPVRYPLTLEPEGTVSYALEVHRCDEYVYPDAKTIGRVPTICNCKEDLTFEWDDEELVPTFERSLGIFAECEQCSRTFDPSKGSAIIKNPFDGPTPTN